MEAIVNNKYRYIMFYGAKVACTSLRNLYLALHRDELSEQQLNSLDEYHNLNEVCPFDPQADYTGYYKFYISRNPYSRIVSAFLDQYVFAKNAGVKAMLEQFPPEGGLPNNFIEFLHYLHTVPDYLRDSHFQSQWRFGHKRVLNKKPLLGKPKENQIVLDYVADVGGYQHELSSIYKRIFKDDPDMQRKALHEIENQPRLNTLLYDQAEWPDAATLDVQQLYDMAFAPKPQDFVRDQSVRKMVQSIYAKDFEMLSYGVKDIPHKNASRELDLIPDDFDWQDYALLNPDLVPNGYQNQRMLTFHYLVHGRNEQKKRFYKLEAPEGFEWRTYLALNADLPAAGIDTERDALIHYLTFGYHENRSYQENP